MQLRFLGQRFLGITFIIGFIFFFIGPVYYPNVYFIIGVLMNLLLVMNITRMAIGLVITVFKTRQYLKTNWNSDSNNTVIHVIVIPNYNEDYTTLFNTISVLASHSRAKSNYRIVLAMEIMETHCISKASSLLLQFSDKFLSINYSVHPNDIPNEAIGKSSNVSWAIKNYAHDYTLAQKIDINNEIITVMDADTLLSEKYFECIAYKYNNTTDKELMMFAPILVFDRNSNDIPMLVRLTDLCWSIGLMANFQLPVNFTCSVYSVSHLLAKNVGYWDTGSEAIGEDVHMAIKCLTHTRMALKFNPVYIPASCSNVQGDTYLSTIYERFEQSKRHLWGVLDFGYAFEMLINLGCFKVDPSRSLLCLYLIFEIVFQPYFGMYYYPQHDYYLRVITFINAFIIITSYEIYHYMACGVRFSSPIHTSYRSWHHIFDWLSFPFCTILYYIIPGINAVVSQLFTNKLRYKVSLKPKK